MWLPAAVLLMASATTVATDCRLRNYGPSAFCSGRQLKEVPADLPANIIQLDMSHNNLEVLHSSSLQNYSQLETLNLSSCSLELVSARVFQHLTRLIKLDLSFNKLTYVGNDILKNNQQLNLVVLSGNKFLFTPDAPFLISSSIQWLYLVDCGLQQIFGTTFSELSQLTYLELSSNQLTHIVNDIFENNRKLEVVVLNGNHKLLLTPEKPFLISSSIQQLHMAHCGIQQIFGTTFRELSQLTYLDLSVNNITSISADAFDNNALQKLKIDSVEYIRPAIRRLCQSSTFYRLGYNSFMVKMCPKSSTGVTATESDRPTKSASKECESPTTSVSVHLSGATTDVSSSSSSSLLTSTTSAAPSTAGSLGVRAGEVCGYIAVIVLAGVALGWLGRKYCRKRLLVLLRRPEYEYVAPAYRMPAMGQRQIPEAHDGYLVPNSVPRVPLPNPRPRSDVSQQYEPLTGSLAGSRGQVAAGQRRASPGILYYNNPFPTESHGADSY